MTNRLISLIADNGSALLPLALVSVLCCRETPPAEVDRELPLQATEQEQLFLAAAKVALPPIGVSPTDLPDPESEGANLAQLYCTACHELPTPLIHSATDWPRVVRRMWLRMDGLAGDYHVAIPTSAERVVMLRYLIDNAIKVSRVALPPGPERASFAATCGRCHELPDPKQYAYEDWIAVVQRMAELMESMLGDALTREEYSKIVRYLETASRTTP